MCFFFRTEPQLRVLLASNLYLTTQAGNPKYALSADSVAGNTLAGWMYGAWKLDTLQTPGTLQLCCLCGGKIVKEQRKKEDRRKG